MRTIALGLALFGLPVVSAAFPLSHAAYRPPEAAAPAASPRAEVVVTKHVAPEPPAPSQHRDDESGAVIMEIRMGPKGVGRKERVHCHGHVFPARDDRDEKPRQR